MIGDAAAAVSRGDAAEAAREVLSRLPLPLEEKRAVLERLRTERATDLAGRVRPVIMPRLRRTPMAPGEPKAPGAAARVGPGRPAAWRDVGALRRVALLLLVTAQTGAAAWLTTAVLPYHGERPLEVAILALSTLLLGWVSVGFWTAVAGFLVLLAGRARPLGPSPADGEAGELPADARTAVVMPIANEDVARVFAGLEATYTSVARTGALDRFDFFVLSDSSDADVRVAEAMAWLRFCCEADAFGRVFYRWRRHRIKRKSGNVADFCRRWGGRYRYMVVLDADSVMSGGCLTSLVRRMEADPTAGIIQTAPRAAGRVTPFGRLQQFAIRVYGPLFAAGIAWWQLGASYYWGHNAIIRVAPFMRHCALGRLRGRGQRAREILSHDFVEAALMRRAGWSVWIAHDLTGSYEEVPATLDDELRRDARWCRGNLINARFSLAEGLHPAHRAVFLGGVMSYVSAPLWLASLALTTASIALQALVPPRYFLHPRQLFPVWPEWHRAWALALTLATAAILFAPKVLGLVLALVRGARDFGGPVRLAASALVEMIASAVVAPVRMVFHTLFVAAALAGRRLDWRSPRRDDAQTTWGEAARRYGPATVLALAWAAGVGLVAPAFLWWLLPVAGALAVSIPAAVLSSRASLGRRLRAARILSTPEETRPPLELRLVRRALRRGGPSFRFADAIVDPVVNAVACAISAPRRGDRPLVLGARRRLVAAALDGPGALGARQRMLLLSDPVALAEVHAAVWASPAARARWER
jgi:membrane glycosyltransferase